MKNFLLRLPGRIRIRNRLRVLNRELRQLQRQYHTSPAKDDRVILRYLELLGHARELNEAMTPRATLRRLHVGSGGHRLRGWINIDVFHDASVDTLADAAVSLPFRDASIDLIHSEDFIEHIEPEAGAIFLQECFRVLRPGGVVRTLTPDLAAIVKKVYQREDPTHLAWCRRDLNTHSPCQALNMHLRMSGEHRFLYDGPELREALRRAGFTPRDVSYNESPHPFLRYLDLRDFGLSLYLEGVKPTTAT